MSFKELVTQYGDNRAWSTQARRAALEKRFDSIDQAPAALRNYLIGTANRMRYKKQALIELKALEAE
jgi:hypothetical protein